MTQGDALSGKHDRFHARRTDLARVRGGGKYQFHCEEEAKEITLLMVVASVVVGQPNNLQTNNKHKPAPNTTWRAGA